MFPLARLYFYDFSSSAMKMTASSYGNTAEPWTSQGRCDLVYCSNVIEHIEELDAFLKMLAQQPSRYLVILAPYNEGIPIAKPFQPKDQKMSTSGQLKKGW